MNNCNESEMAAWVMLQKIGVAITDMPKMNFHVRVGMANALADSLVAVTKSMSRKGYEDNNAAKYISQLVNHYMQNKYDGKPRYPGGFICAEKPK